MFSRWFVEVIGDDKVQPLACIAVGNTSWSPKPGIVLVGQGLLARGWVSGVATGDVALLSPRTKAESHQKLMQHQAVVSLKCCPDSFALLPVAMLLSLAIRKVQFWDQPWGPGPLSLGASAGSLALPRSSAGCSQHVSLHLSLSFCLTLRPSPLGQPGASAASGSSDGLSVRVVWVAAPPQGSTGESSGQKPAPGRAGSGRAEVIGA